MEIRSVYKLSAVGTRLIVGVLFTLSVTAMRIHIQLYQSLTFSRCSRARIIASAVDGLCEVSVTPYIFIRAKGLLMPKTKAFRANCRAMRTFRKSMAP